MSANGEQLPLFEPVVPPPNGRVTQGELYRALHNMDLAYTDRFNVIFEALNDYHDDLREMRRGFEQRHADKNVDGASTTAEVNGGIVLTVRLTPRRMALLAGILVPLAAILGAVASIFEGAIP